MIKIKRKKQERKKKGGRKEGRKEDLRMINIKRKKENMQRKRKRGKEGRKIAYENKGVVKKELITEGKRSSRLREGAAEYIDCISAEG